MPARPDSYDELAHWRRYAGYFPARVRDKALPTEERWAWGGWDVHLDRFHAPGSRATIVLLHGAGSCGRVLWPFGAAFRDHGWTCVAPDMPGYGLTRGPAGPFPFALWVDLATALVEREAAAGPVVLFGVSLGGPLGYHVAARSPHVRGLVATMLPDPRERATRRSFASPPALGQLGPAVLDVTAPLTDAVKVPLPWVTPMRKVSNDAGFAAKFRTDPHAGGSAMPLRFLRTMLEATPPVEPEDYTGPPVLVVHPAADRWTDPELTRRFLDRLACEKELVLLENAGHAPIEEPGATQLETAMLAFLERTVGSR